MAYTKEAIADTTTAIPTAPPAVMRDEMVREPYSTRAQPKTPPVGQENKGGDVALEETKPAADTVTLSPQVAALARREQKFRQQQQELAAQKKTLEAEKAEIAQLKAMKEKLAAKDYSGLEGLVDYEAYTDYSIKKLNGTDPNQEALKKLETEMEGMKKTQQDSLNKQYEAAVNQRRVAVKELVETKEDFSRIKGMGLQEAVVQHILDTFENDSLELSPEQAAKEVEELLLEKANQWAKFSSLKTSPEPDEKKQLPPLKQGLKTITNQVTTGEINRPAKSFQHMSDQERWAEARRRAEERLQKQG